MTAGQRLAQAAEALIGAPFRPGGRDPATGLDCLGLVIAALRLSGHASAGVPPWPLRQMRLDHLLPFAALHGLSPATVPARPGDVLLVRTGPAQPHLLVRGRGDHVIHAHAGLRRVCLTPLPMPWPCERIWRLPELE